MSTAAVSTTMLLLDNSSWENKDRCSGSLINRLLVGMGKKATPLKFALRWTAARRESMPSAFVAISAGE